MRKGRSFVFASLLFLLATGCSGEQGQGEVQVFVEAEDSIPEGLEPGTGLENVHDGWSVTYEKFLVAIGNFRAARLDGGERLSDPKVYIVDLKNLAATGFVLSSFRDAAAVRFDKVGFDLPNATASTLAAPATSHADYDLMVTGGYSIYFEATLTKPDGRSCLPTHPTDCVDRPSLRIKWGLRAGTAFDDCAPGQGAAGFAVPTGGTAQVKPTLHGDHWFFTNISQGAEMTERRAQWIVDADLDRDGETTLTELRNVRAADLFFSPTYNLSGALVPIVTAYDYLEAQARTIGDFQGDGECPTRAPLP